MKQSLLTRLLHGPYHPPALKRGQRATCYYRDTDVVITSWSNARLSWPRCKAPGQRGGSGLLVDTELLRAIRTESTIAIAYWWGVCPDTVSLWRRTLNVERWTQGSQRLRQDLNSAQAAALRGTKWTPDRTERARQAAIAQGRKYPDNRKHRWKHNGWKRAQLALLGAMPDQEVAKRTGHTVVAVRIQRTRRGIPKLDDNRRRWTAEELALLGTMPDAQVAARTGNTVKAVLLRRCALQIAVFGHKPRGRPRAHTRDDT